MVGTGPSAVAVREVPEARSQTAPGREPDAASFEVATVASDTLRASVRISGALTTTSCSVLICVLRAHLRAGRHYLRVDVAESPILDPAVVSALADTHRQVAEAGGMLVFENAGPRVIDAIRTSTLFVRPSY